MCCTCDRAPGAAFEFGARLVDEGAGTVAGPPAIDEHATSNGSNARIVKAFIVSRTFGRRLDAPRLAFRMEREAMRHPRRKPQATKVKCA